MKLSAYTRLFAFSMLLASTGLTGCTLDTPALSAKQRFAQIHRNDVYELEQVNDDLDHFALMRPSSQLTVWNVYHR